MLSAAELREASGGGGQGRRLPAQPPGHGYLAQGYRVSNPRRTLSSPQSSPPAFKIYGAGFWGFILLFRPAVLSLQTRQKTSRDYGRRSPDLCGLPGATAALPARRGRFPAGGTTAAPAGRLPAAGRDTCSRTGSRFTPAAAPGRGSGLSATDTHPSLARPPLLSRHLTAPAAVRAAVSAAGQG